MTIHTYKEIVSKSKEIKKNVKKEYSLGESSKWGYYIAKAIVNPKKDIKKIEFKEAPNPNGDNISRQISKSSYISLAKDLIEFVEKKHRLPNYLEYKNIKIRTRVYVEFFARILVFYNENNRLPNEADINSKAFTKPLEPTNEVYKYFVKVFGSFDNTVDGFLKKIQGRGYGYYYDDVLSNKQVIDNLKSSKSGVKKPNCTDSCQMAMNIIKQLIAWGLYKKVECLHVDCSSGGHVKLRITRNDGSTFIRDIACIISDNDKPLTCVWCSNSPKAVNPNWFMSNLNR